jgi:hypothetical protein
LSTEWSPNVRKIKIKKFLGNPGPTATLEKSKKELDFVYLIFPENLIERLTVETNRYAEQAQLKKGHDDKNWSPVTIPEMKAFIGIRVYMSVVHLPTMKMYWSEDELYGNFPLAKIMPRNRYDKICQYLHAVNNADQLPKDNPNHDKLFLIRPILDAVTTQCQVQYKPHEQQSIDEAMVAFRGRLGWRQYLPAKPTKYGIKVWMRASPINGYAHDMQVYTGKSKEKGAEVGLGERVIKDLCIGIGGKNHTVFCDSFFTGVKLFYDLLDYDIYGCGTIRTNRKGYPGETLKKDQKKRKQGDCVILEKDKKCAAIVWRDKKEVYLLSTAHDPTDPLAEVNRRQKDGTVKIVPCPPPLASYNKYMNGVDRADGLRAQYPTYRMCKRWWTYLLWFALDVAMANAYILWCESPNHKDSSSLSFRKEVGRQLIGTYSHVSGTNKKKTPTVTPKGLDHWPMTVKKRMRCRHCLTKKLRHESRVQCSGCPGVHLCIDCFKPWHKSLVSASTAED